MVTPMSPFFATPDFVPGTADARDRVADGGPPKRRKAGPVLMGDLHATMGGRPLLLALWDVLDAEERDR